MAMRLHLHLDVEIARQAAGRAPLRLDRTAATSELSSMPGRHRDVDHPGLRGAAPAPAFRTGIGDRDAFAAARGTRLRGHELTENRLLDPPHFAGAAAGRAARRSLPVPHPRAVAGFARFQTKDFDFLFGAEDGFFEGEIERSPGGPDRASVLACRRLWSRRRAPPKKLSKRSPKGEPPKPPNGSAPLPPMPLAAWPNRS